MVNQGNARRRGGYGRIVSYEPLDGWQSMIPTSSTSLLLLVGGEELQKLLQTLPEQPTDYESHIRTLDQHFKVL